MKRDGHDNVTFFVGPEVEHTPAYSKRTLFVVGKPTLAQIEEMAKEHKTTHIFMGANHSFSCESKDLYWNQVITALLDKGFWVSLDYEAHTHKDVLQMLNPGIWQCRTFVPLLSVRIPNVQTSSPNLTIKIDDVDFNATNPGVWCLHHHEVTDSNRFTDWQEYETDVVIKDKVYADINKPSVNLEDLKKAVFVDTTIGKVEDREEVEVVKLNDSDAGLDATPITALKPELETETVVDETITPTDAAAAYAEGAKDDPLGKEGSKKVAKKSKVTQ